MHYSAAEVGTEHVDSSLRTANSRGVLHMGVREARSRRCACAVPMLVWLWPVVGFEACELCFKVHILVLIRESKRFCSTALAVAC